MGKDGMREEERRIRTCSWWQVNCYTENMVTFSISNRLHLVSSESAEKAPKRDGESEKHFKF